MNVMIICVRITPPVWMTSINTSVTVCLVTLAHSVKRRSMSVNQGRCVTLHSKIHHYFLDPAFMLCPVKIE